MSRFWVQKHNCEGVEAFVDLQIGESNECVEYENCDEVTRYCLYASEYGHQFQVGILPGDDGIFSFL